MIERRTVMLIPNAKVPRGFFNLAKPDLTGDGMQSILFESITEKANEFLVPPIVRALLRDGVLPYIFLNPQDMDEMNGLAFFLGDVGSNEYDDDE